MRFSWQAPTKGYTLIPGAYYNGNVQEKTHDIPRIDLPEHPRFRFPLSAASVLAVLIWDGAAGGAHYSSSPYSAAGWNGVTLDGEKEILSFDMPATDSDQYGYPNWVVRKRPPHAWCYGTIDR